MVSQLTFQFIGNACGIFTGRNGTRILCDPWIVDGVFEGSWCHYPPLKTTVDDLKNIDAIYVSHLHPDHFDERFFDFGKDLPLIILDHGDNFLMKKLNGLGYNNLIKIKDGETRTFEEFELTCFAPFAKHIFHEAAVGNLIDSALLVSCGSVIAFNANDNTPSTASAKALREKFGDIDLAMLNYNAAGPYPSCFDNLNESAKLSEHRRILERNFDHVVSILNEMKPRCFLPFAGAYALGGKESHKNKCLGTTTWDECADYVRSAETASYVITLREGDVFDIENRKSDKPYVKVDLDEMQNYIQRELSAIEYPYEREDWPEPSVLLNELKTASVLMKQRWRRYGIRSDARVYLDIFDDCVQIYPNFDEHAQVKEDGYLRCKMDLRLLHQILHRRAHWNNAEIGAHINFYRSPNSYQPDLHTGLQFLHL